MKGPEIHDVFQEHYASLSDPRLVVDREDGRNTLARIVYGKDWSKGEAWQHLQNNPPTLMAQNGPMRPWAPTMAGRTTKDGRPFKENPYRKAHTDDHWAWMIAKWEPGSARVKGPVKPKATRQTRYERILDDEWLDAV